MVVGVLSAFAGIIQATRIHIAAPWTAQTMNLEAIAGAVVGGTLLSGGVGSILGAVLGALSIRVLYIGLTMMGISPYYFMIAVGILLIMAVASNVMVRRRVLHRQLPKKLLSRPIGSAWSQACHSAGEVKGKAGEDTI